MFDMSKFVESKSKPLPVVLLLDVSSSMFGEKIKSLNFAVREMIKSFSDEENGASEIWVSIIAFNTTAKKIFSFTSASKIRDIWESRNIRLEADGLTSMGEALKIAKDMIESKDETPPKAYRPTVVLISDGAPTDDWEAPMQDFISNGRSSKCDRMAMAIGAGEQEDVLRKFISGTQNALFTADDAAGIVKFFKQVTMSVTTRKNSKNPNMLLPGSVMGSGSTIIIGDKPDSERIF